jgi:hypothetical protein
MFVDNLPRAEQGPWETSGSVLRVSTDYAFAKDRRELGSTLPHGQTRVPDLIVITLNLSPASHTIRSPRPRLGWGEDACISYYLLSSLGS